MISLLWSAARGPIAAVLVVGVWSILRLNHHQKVDVVVLRVMSIFILLSILCFFVPPVLGGIFFRGETMPDRFSFGVFYDLFVSSRLVYGGINRIDFLRPTVFGLGYGYLSAGGTVNGIPNIESFPLRIWVELGVVGSLLYLIAFAAITLSVVKAEKKITLCSKSRYLETKIFLLVWGNSIASFGFSLPTGTLLIYLLLGSISCSFLQNICRG